MVRLVVRMSYVVGLATQRLKQRWLVGFPSKHPTSAAPRTDASAPPYMQPFAFWVALVTYESKGSGITPSACRQENYQWQHLEVRIAGQAYYSNCGFPFAVPSNPPKKGHPQKRPSYGITGNYQAHDGKCNVLLSTIFGGLAEAPGQRGGEEPLAALAHAAEAPRFGSVCKLVLSWNPLFGARRTQRGWLPPEST